MSRKTKAEYEDLIAKTRGKIPASLPSVENDRPSPAERLCRLAEIQCHIMLETRQSTFDTLTVLRQMSKALGEMQFSSGLPPNTTVSYSDPLLRDLVEEKENDSTAI